MAHTREFTIEAISRKIGLGALEIQNIKRDIKERLEVDHWMGGMLTENGEQDGAHKKVTLGAISVAPSALANTNFIYSRIINGFTELCCLTEIGTEILLTHEGRYIYEVSPASLSYGITSQTFVPGLWRTILFDQETESIGAGMSLTTGVFTAPESAKYYAHCYLGTTSTIHLRLMVNSSNVFQVQYREMAIPVSVTAGDTLYFQVYCSSGFIVADATIGIYKI